MLRRGGMTPLLRVAAWAAGAAWREVWGRLADRLYGAEERARRRQARRERDGVALADTLGALRGAWVKLGQFAALRYDLLPETLRGPLASLHDRAPATPLPEVRRTVELELGAPLETHFPAFAPGPLGSASVAQVHRARTASGEEVAVKVQHPELAAALPRDLACLGLVLRLSAWLSGRSRDAAARLHAEFSRALCEELDFRHEARVAAEIAANLSAEPRIVVPRVLPGLSTRRVLTMTFHRAVSVADRAGLERLGVAPGDVLRVLARAYARQVFVDGLFHADPHPGNLFVLDEPPPATGARVLFVDFGLSRRLDPGLRDEMRRGIHALLQRDVAGFVEGMDRMGMVAPGAHAAVRQAVEDMFRRLAAAGPGGPLALAGGAVLPLKDEAKRLLQETPGLQLPNDLLLYAKTLAYLFALGDALDPDVDLMRVALPYLLRFLASGGEARPAGAPARA